MSLTQRFRDLKLALKFLFWGWFCLTPLALFAAAWLMAPAGLSPAWRGYLSAKLAEAVGLGQIPIVPVAGAWMKPTDILVWQTENIPTATLADWDSNFLTLALVPLIVALVLAMTVSAILLYRKKGTSK